MIGTGYAVVLPFAAVVLYKRHAWEAAHSAEVIASSGMYAAGDMMLYLFITFLFLIPTIFPVRVISKFEVPATVYSKTLLVIGLTAPLCLGILFLGHERVPNLSAYCFFRLLWSPVILALMTFSRIMAKFQITKRLSCYALLAETTTLCLSIVLIILSGKKGTA